WILLNSIFEATRERVGPHYWDEATFSARLGQAGVSVLGMRGTLLGGASLLVWARKSAGIRGGTTTCRFPLSPRPASSRPRPRRGRELVCPFGMPSST